MDFQAESLCVNTAKYKYKLIEVVWDDSITDSGWEATPENLEPSLAVTVGFLVRETQEHILIASTYDEDHTNARLQIPKKCIKSRKELK